MFCVNSRNMYAKCLDGRGWQKSIFASLKQKPVGRVSVVLDNLTQLNLASPLLRFWENLESYRKSSQTSYRKILQGLIAALRPRGPEFESRSEVSRQYHISPTLIQPRTFWILIRRGELEGYEILLTENRTTKINGRIRSAKTFD